MLLQSKLSFERSALEHEQLFAKYLKLSGLRVSKGITSFSLCIKLLQFTEEIVHTQIVTYASIRKKIERSKIPMRLNELRDIFGTTVVNLREKK